MSINTSFSHAQIVVQGTTIDHETVQHCLHIDDSWVVSENGTLSSFFSMGGTKVNDYNDYNRINPVRISFVANNI